MVSLRTLSLCVYWSQRLTLCVLLGTFDCDDADCAAHPICRSSDPAGRDGRDGRDGRTLPRACCQLLYSALSVACARLGDGRDSTRDNMLLGGVLAVLGAAAIAGLFYWCGRKQASTSTIRTVNVQEALPVTMVRPG